MSDMLLSIIIPAYNAERFLRKTLELLVMQGIDLCEVIVINDGSVDGTETICTEFSQKYQNFQYFSQENQGVSAARNIGIKKAQGKYIYFLDSDDSLTDGTLDFFKEVLTQKSEFDVFVFGYAVQKNAAAIKTVVPNIPAGIYPSSTMINKLFLGKKIPCLICSSLYRRDFLLKNAIFFPLNVKIGEDIVFMVYAFTKAKILFYHKRVSFIYQIREDSVMQGYKGYNIDRIKSFEVVRDAVLNNTQYYTSVQKEANFFIANLYLANLVAYFKASFKDSLVNTVFLENKFFLYKNIRGRFINSTAIRLARCIPLRILFTVFKGNR